MEGGFQREVSDEGGLVGGGLWRTVIIMIVVAVLLIGSGVVEWDCHILLLL